MNRLDDKVALITGGARGQGAAEAELFVNAGAQVVITDVLDDEGEATAERLGAACEFLHHDVASEVQWAHVVDTIVETHGRLDVLVNNAGIFRTVGLIETSLEMWQQMMDINQTGVFLGMRTTLPSMLEGGEGSIVNVSSMWGIIGTSGVAAYQASKGAVTMMTKNAAATYANRGIRVNSVHPGFIWTPMTEAQDADISQGLIDKTPMARAGLGNEVAAGIAFLASEDASFITGVQLLIDGGFTTI